jgi:hypothetical protein
MMTVIGIQSNEDGRNMIAEILVWGFFSAVGWWSANYFVIEPYFPKHETKIEKKVEDERTKTTN